MQRVYLLLKQPTVDDELITVDAPRNRCLYIPLRHIVAKGADAEAFVPVGGTELPLSSDRDLVGRVLCVRLLHSQLSQGLSPTDPIVVGVRVRILWELAGRDVQHMEEYLRQNPDTSRRLMKLAIWGAVGVGMIVLANILAVAVASSIPMWARAFGATANFIILITLVFAVGAEIRDGPASELPPKGVVALVLLWCWFRKCCYC